MEIVFATDLFLFSIKVLAISEICSHFTGFSEELLVL